LQCISRLSGWTAISSIPAGVRRGNQQTTIPLSGKANREIEPVTSTGGAADSSPRETVGKSRGMVPSTGRGERKGLAMLICRPYPGLTEEEMASYAECMKIYGEVDAMRWVVQQHPPSNP
jgi:hypothetical protein